MAAPLFLGLGALVSLALANKVRKNEKLNQQMLEKQGVRQSELIKLRAQAARDMRAFSADPKKGRQVQPSAYSNDIISFAQKYGMDPRLLDDIIFAESSYNPNSVSKTGAMGLGQLQNIALDDIKYKGPRGNALLDPRLNIDLTAQYINRLGKNYGVPMDDPYALYTAYSMGVGNWKKGTPLSPAYKANFDRAYRR